jgi:hypothetical protein
MIDKKITFKVEHYIDAYTSAVHEVFKVYVEDETLVYMRDNKRERRNIIDYICDFIKEFDVVSMQTNTYTLDFKERNAGYSVTAINPPDYVTDDTID